MDTQKLAKQERDKLLKKWTPFLEGISDEYIVENTAMLLENEAKYLAEAGGQPGGLNTGDVQGLQKVMLPIVRRVFPNLIANNIVSVQPISAPAGIIFYLKYQQGTERPGNDGGYGYGQGGTDGRNPSAAEDYPEFSMFENYAGSGEGYNPYYSTDEIGPFIARVTTADHTGKLGDDETSTVDSDTVAIFDVNPSVVPPRNFTYNNRGVIPGSRVPIQAIWPIAANIGGTSAGNWGTSPAGSAGTAATNGYGVYAQYFGTLELEQVSGRNAGRTITAAIQIPLSATFTPIAGGIVVKSTTGEVITGVEVRPGTAAAYAGAKDDGTTVIGADHVATVEVEVPAEYKILEGRLFYKTDMEYSTSIPEMRITIGNIPVAVKTRKLKAMWSQESEQDLKAYHGLSADAELTALVSNEMIAEIDREIVQRIINLVPQTSRYNYNWADYAGNNASGNYLDAHLGLMQKITVASNEIYRKSKLGPANWMIVGTKLSSYIEVLKGFIPNPVTASMGMNVVKAGTYAGRFDIYKDPLFIDDYILIGHKSSQSPFGSGLVYSPYVTNLTPVIVGQDDFNPRRGFLARYALTEVPFGSYLYGSVRVQNVPN
jgi:hypothetical protein